MFYTYIIAINFINAIVAWPAIPGGRGAGGAMAPHFFWSKIFFMNIIMANAFDSLVKAKKEKIFVWGRSKPKPF